MSNLHFKPTVNPADRLAINVFYECLEDVQTTLKDYSKNLDSMLEDNEATETYHLFEDLSQFIDIDIHDYFKNVDKLIYCQVGTYSVLGITNPKGVKILTKQDWLNSYQHLYNDLSECLQRA